jgi:hypothetical protein
MLERIHGGFERSARCLSSGADTGSRQENTTAEFGVPVLIRESEPGRGICEVDAASSSENATTEGIERGF